jgi:L-iditol 2-dehydrogenase
MKALVFLGPGRMELGDRPDPEGEVLVRILGSGVCGTDLKTFLKGHHLFVPPTVLGHECFGRVEKATAASGLSPGELVAAAPYLECGVCPTCSKGLGELCSSKDYISGGCFAERFAASSAYAKRGLFRIGEPRPAFALVEPLACVLNGLSRLGKAGKGKILVVGGGPMGALFGMVLEERGLPFAIVEVGSWRASLLKSWAWDLRRPDDIQKGDWDGVVLAVNIAGLVPRYLSLVAEGGTLLLFAGYPRQERAEIDPYDIHYREVRIDGSFGYAHAHFEEALSLVSTHPERYERLITHRVPLDRWESAFEALRKGEAQKVVFEP